MRRCWQAQGRSSGSGGVRRLSSHFDGCGVEHVEFCEQPHGGGVWDGKLLVVLYDGTLPLLCARKGIVKSGTEWRSV